MIAELGQRIGEVETLVRLFPEHEQRIRQALDEHGQHWGGAMSRLESDFEALKNEFLGHRHDAPAHVERDAAEILDSPVHAIDDAVSSVVPTPPAPTEPVQAPPAMKELPAYHSRIHRGR